MEPITWKTETRKLGELKGWDPNPRLLKEEQAKRLIESIRKFGYSQVIEIEPDNTIIDGHQRNDVMLLMEEFGKNKVVEVRVASRKFTLEERKKYIVYKHRGAVGEWDWDKIFNLYEPDELLEYGFNEYELSFALPDIEGNLEETDGEQDFSDTEQICITASKETVLRWEELRKENPEQKEGELLDVLISCYINSEPLRN